VIIITLRCVIPVVCVTNEREESVVKQHNLLCCLTTLSSLSLDHDYKIQASMMNDDSVSEYEIGLTKENCGPVFKSRFSQKL